MYYDDLTNTELRTYHHYAQMDSISVCLLWMQNSDLFMVQSLGNNVYKVYPLFYVDKIECTEPNAKILDNKCVILIETENTASSQTYINFISNQNNGVIYQYDSTNRNNTSSTIPVLQIGDTLTEANYNNLVQVIRDNVILNNPIKILDGVVTGSFGKYDFNIKDVSLVDNGILVTEETITNGLTVTLLDPIYEYSTYELILQVAKISDVHLDNSSNTNFKTVTPLTVTLKPFEEVTIPLTSLAENTVILYEANVQVTHDKPYIQQIYGFKNFTVTYNQYLLENNTLTAKYISETLSGNTITFKAKKVNTESYITLGTATTNNEGIATLTFTPLNKGMTTGDYVYYAETENITINSNSYTYENYPTKTTITTPNYDSSTGFLTVTGTVTEKINNTEVQYSNGVAYITVYKDGVFVTEGTKSFSGASFTEYMHLGSVGTYTVNVKLGNSGIPLGYSKPSTATKNYTVLEDTTLTIVITDPDPYGDGSLYTKSVLKDSNNQPISNRTLNITKTYSGGGGGTSTVTTDSNGEATNPTFRPSWTKVVVSFDGDTQYNSSSATWTRS